MHKTELIDGKRVKTAQLNNSNYIPKKRNAFDKYWKNKEIMPIHMMGGWWSRSSHNYRDELNYAIGRMTW